MIHRQRGGIIPGIPGSPPRIRPFLPILFMRFIIRVISWNCFMSLLTSCTVVPEPTAIRRLRDALMISGRRRSDGVIDMMMAS